MQRRLPEYLKRPIIDTDKTRTVRKILKTKCLNTVCENARCPNKNECYTKNTATFLIMGNNCTRNCRYCNISCARPEPLDLNEPSHVAEAVKDLGLKYSVITGLMIGLGETFEQIEETLLDLKNVGCDIVTIGQYIQPSKEHLEVSKYYTPEEYDILRALSDKIGIKHSQIGPLVRSSYRAAELI